MLTAAQVDQYLERIGLKRPMPLTRDTLNTIILAHYCHIPYENLDTMGHVPVSLDEKSLFEKLILRRRGGWCFELNGALALLLQGLGFQVRLLAARFIMGEPPETLPLRRHEILLVTLPDGQYICDAGIMRESYRIALRMEYGLIQGDGMGEYRMESHPFYGHLIYQRLEKDEFEPLMGFTLEPQIPDDYIMPSFYCEHHPDSPFTRKRMVGIYTQDGSWNLVGNTLKRIEQGRVISARECQDGEIPQILQNYFHLTV